MASSESEPAQPTSAGAGRHAWCTVQRMLYTSLGVVALAVVTAVIVQRVHAKRRASREETERDIERAEGEGMVGHVASER
jgi:ribose 1,5-bisphosphokinase PhnN